MESLHSVMPRIQLLLFGFISPILIVLFSIAGCSDPSNTGSITSYTGSMLTPVNVDDYLTSITGGTYCIYNDTGSSCIDLVPLVNGGVKTNGPIIHIYPEKTRYIFYHEGTPIARVERIGDTSDFVETLTDPDQAPPKRGTPTPGNNNNGDDDDDDTNGGDGNNDNNGDDDDDDDTNGGDGNNDNNGDDDDDDDTNGGDGNNDNNGDDDDDDTNGGDDNNDNNGDDDNDDNPDNTDPTDNTNDGHGWLIWIYYPEGTAPINPPTLSKSNVIVTINGKQLTDEDITGFAQFIGLEGERGIQFFYPTDSAELLDLKVQMGGITDREGNVRFNINYLWHSN